MDEEIWDFDCAGTVITFDDKEVKVQEQLTEVLDDRMGQQHVLALAENTKTAESHMEEKKIAIDLFSCEVHAAERFGNAGYGPKYVAHWGQVQGTGWPLDGGTVFFLFMSTVPGEDVDEIRDELSDRKLHSIRRQLARILEFMRKDGYKLYEQQFVVFLIIE
ncbi:hypothetical protein BDV27DRAFT_162131 [Aspergillus caelatus]|uniref:Uncharacterized protein n=1 Tax=Aspergillus caelatus TaxID=61420 RepID=A0A5N6ZQN6_9EURO|nr:uncharacterized protein BDV27DRAFT_162131 [Aspergillus caelatus]KAE8359947.1 hypothetical protein BDV27DRAFT_162131 [Aspergillus caelatus]